MKVGSKGRVVVMACSLGVENPKGALDSRYCWGRHLLLAQKNKA